ncbi:DUF2029 domain-containing protein [Corynebacterium sp. 4HC-13]|uniref:glycosyltransferase family 87 protein n=1 Tax=Corynebacterium anserum TaxID=2684406 RepID=UPI00163B25DD|nr:glycosyltransferase family 87 protein [Corynebacterium anserum]MBC2682347.1 DUF2029 domain-containing protein [Corynebacterium anserum]
MPFPSSSARGQSRTREGNLRSDHNRPRILSGYVVALSVIAGLVNVLYWSGRQQPDDWSSLWIAGVLVKNGNSAHIYDFDPIDFAAWSGPAWQKVIETNELSPYPHPFVHIPGVAYIIAPFTHFLSFEDSVMCLTALCGACLPLLVSASWTLWSRTTLPLHILLAATIAAWYTTAFQTGMWLGQTTPIILTMTVCGIAAARHHPLTAGVLLGLAGIVKLTPLGLIPLMLVFRHYRRSAVATTVTAALAALASLTVGGRELFATWLDRIHRLSDSVVVSGANRSFASAALRDKSTAGPVAPLVDDIPNFVSVIPIAIAVILFAAIIWAASRQHQQAAPLILIGAYATATATSSLMWHHYLLICTPLAIGIAVHSQHLTSGVREIFRVLLLVTLLLLYPPLNDDFIPVLSLHGLPLSGLALPWAGFTALVSLIALLAVSAAAPPRSQQVVPVELGKISTTPRRKGGKHAKPKNSLWRRMQ